LLQHGPLLEDPPRRANPCSQIPEFTPQIVTRQELIAFSKGVICDHIYRDCAKGVVQVDSFISGELGRNDTFQLLNSGIYKVFHFEDISSREEGIEPGSAGFVHLGRSRSEGGIASSKSTIESSRFGIFGTNTIDKFKLSGSLRWTSSGVIRATVLAIDQRLIVVRILFSTIFLVEICNLNVVPAFPVMKAEVGFVEIGGSRQFGTRNMSKGMPVNVVTNPLHKRSSV